MNDDHVTLPDDERDQPTQIQPAADGEAGDIQESAPEPVLPSCAECGEPIEEDQPYCLECGAPTPNAPKLRRRLGPAGILAIGLGVLGIGAGTLAYALSKNDSPTAIASTGATTGPVTLPPLTQTFTSEPTSSVDVTDPTTGTPFPSSTSTFPPATTTSTFTSPSTTSTFTPSTTTTPPPQTTTIGPGPTTTGTTPPPSSGAADTWPDGVAGWTVILASATDQAAAIAFRNKVTGSGRAAGLIESSLYATLEPDLWVVWTGQYTSRTAAISQAAALRATYKDAYAQRVEEL